jgi:hypothetical protein
VFLRGMRCIINILKKVKCQREGINMWTVISVLSALGVKYYNPKIPESKKSMVINKNYYQRIGFPYKYFEGEFLSEEEVDYQLRLIYIYLMFTLSTSVHLASSVAVILPPLPPVHRISPCALDSIRAKNRKNLRYIQVIRKRTDKVMFSDKEI